MAGRSSNGEGSIRKRRNDGLWEARVTVGDSRKSIYGKSKSDVRNKMIEIQVDIANQDYLDETNMTVSQWMQTWMDDFLEARPSTVKRYDRDVRLRIIPYLGNIKLKELTTIQVQKMYRKCKDNGLSPKSIHNLHGVLHEALKKAVSLKYIKTNPCDECTLPKKPKAEMHPIVDDNTHKFLQAIKGDRYEDLFFFDIFTGLRESEACGLTWDCVDFDKGTIRVYRQLLRVGVKDGKGVFDFAPLKNDRERTIEPAVQVMEHLRRIQMKQKEYKLMTGGAYSNPKRFVFTDELGKPFHYHTMYTHFKEIVKKIGMPEARFHDLRHTYATLSIQNGSDVKTISESLGHSTVAFTMDRYGHVSNQMRKDSAERMERMIASLK